MTDPGILIYETIHGSRAYGLATETSDTDRRGVFVARLQWAGRPCFRSVLP